MTQCMGDIIVFANLIQPGHYVRHQLLLRMLGLLMAATAAVWFGLLEINNFENWVIGLQLDPKYHRQRHVFIFMRGAQALACWLD